MKKAALFFIGLALVGCQQIPNGTAENSGTEVVQAQNGDLYSIDCLRSNASLITADSSAMAGCKVDMELQARNAKQKCKNCKNWNQNYIVYYPPTYYSPSYTSGGNQFCNYVFGNNWNSNCFNTFGYPQSSSYYYAPSCSQSCLCGSSFSSSCPSSCYSASPYSGYGSVYGGGGSYYYGAH
ncbi:MAG: hypothetical protein HYR96_09275 [Deltaproteobacteria bacterium]|nr:hypothetical protein [Deltaproteobacteria bacterium]MBI3293575.1 hypothetical protein [Deltaproteobacteria bacterium]